MAALSILLSLFAAVVAGYALLPRCLLWLAQAAGYRLRQASQTRRELLRARAASEQRAHEAGRSGDQPRQKEEDDWEEIEGSLVGSAANGGKADRDWHGIIGFFHPFCNAGGGGERVLWDAIRATQRRWPEAICVVYTGDHDVDKAQILERVEDRFNIHLHPPTVHFLYLSKRHLVLSTTWPHFTLLGQSLGSLILAWDAFNLLVPDIFIDTMGYAFALALSSLLFPAVPTGAYVHYPTISTDMLDSLDAGGQGINAESGAGYRGLAKKFYWKLFARLYCNVGSTVDVVMTNSTWTQSHIKSLWGPYRNRRNSTTDHDIDVVFPPVAVAEIEQAIAIDSTSEKNRRPYILYIAQFRPEKNHQLILEAFAAFVHSHPSLPAYPKSETPKLVLIGTVRESDETRIYQLRLLARELNINDDVEFVCDAKWPVMLDWMAKASVGVNGMWSEHFGIGVVEYQAAGLISVVNDSGGPKLDIVIDVDGKPTGFHATTAAQYTSAFGAALTLSPTESLAMRRRARKSSQRFSDRVFAEKWIQNMDRLVNVQVSRATRS